MCLEEILVITEQTNAALTIARHFTRAALTCGCMEERYTLMQIFKDLSCSTQRVDNYIKIRKQRELLEERLYRGEQEFFIAQDDPLPLMEHIPEYDWESTFLERNRFLSAIGIPNKISHIPYFIGIPVCSVAGFL